MTALLSSNLSFAIIRSSQNIFPSYFGMAPSSHRINFRIAILGNPIRCRLVVLSLIVMGHSIIKVAVLGWPGVCTAAACMLRGELRLVALIVVPSEVGASHGMLSTLMEMGACSRRAWHLWLVVMPRERSCWLAVNWALQLQSP